MKRSSSPGPSFTPPGWGVVRSSTPAGQPNSSRKLSGEPVSKARVRGTSPRERVSSR
jgi:hypothetical protein